MVGTKKIALVTGASKGIGKALVEELVSQQWTVVGVARSEDKLNELKQVYGELFIAFTCDTSDHQQVHQVALNLQEQNLVPSLLFLNAGLAGEPCVESLEKFSVSKHEEIFAVNYFGVLHWVEELLSMCLQQKQQIDFIATSSVNAFFAPPTGAAYSASKAAIARAFESLALSYHDSNVNFSVVYPGPVETEGLKIEGKIPFIWSSKRMAKYMYKRAIANKRHSENSFFYSALTRLLRMIPNFLTLKILGKK